MKKFLFLLLSFTILFCQFGFSQTTTQTFNFTGSSQSWTVPSCVTSITVTVAGAKGGGNLGGNGAVVTSTISVTPGQTIQMIVGGMGGSATAGYNGGGLGYASTDGNTSYNSSGGGGSSNLIIGGIPVVIAAGGGGAGGGSGIVGGGAGGCLTGVTGSNTFGSGGSGGSQTAGGMGGTPWASTPPGGQNGSLGQGGNGGFWQTASGGGGGGGYYGGGGGGNDGCCTGANGGGGGSGGSSLIPAGSGCVSGSNAGNGYITISFSGGGTATNTGPYCEGATIQLNSSGGTSYSWTGPNGFTSNLQNPTIPNATLANAGTYNVSVNGGACTANTTVTVSAAPTPNAGTDDIYCLGEPILLNGTVSSMSNTILWSYLANGITPTPTVTFAPNASNVSPTVSTNQPGTYYFILSESNTLCGSMKDTVHILVSQASQTTSFTNPSCFGFNDGSITINNPDGVLYSFDNGVTWSTNNSQSNFTSGSYDVCSQNQYGCITCSNVVLTDPPAMTISVTPDELICENGTAVMTATATGGNTFDYHWDHTSNLNATQSVNPASQTTYQVYAENENGCVSPTESIVISVRPPLSGDITPLDSVCPTYAKVLDATNIAGGLGVPYNFVWSTAYSNSGATSQITVNPSVTTTYTVTITDNCESTPLVLQTTVVAAQVPNPQFIVDDPLKCEPAVFELINTTDPSLNGTNYWVISDGQTFLNTDTVFNEALYDGSYDVQLVVTSPYGCIDSVTYQGYLNVQPIPTADFVYSPTPVMMFNTHVNFNNYSQNASIYYWTFENGSITSSSLTNPELDFPDGVEGTYQVTLIATSELGCSDTITKDVIVLPEILIYAPNSFTPDGDEFNQNWKVIMEGIDVYDFELLIFDRWGQVVWESHDVDTGWDGTMRGQVLPIGVYSWIIRTKDSINDKKYTFNGHITLIK